MIEEGQIQLNPGKRMALRPRIKCAFKRSVRLTVAPCHAPLRPTPLPHTHVDYQQ